MPIYDYYCGKCDDVFEKIVMPSTPQVVCPACGSKKLERMISAPALCNTAAKNAVLHREYRDYRKRWNDNATMPKPKKQPTDA
jgi:putative FmdB family regulatory protein